MIKINKILAKKCMEINLVITDVDGVLTDGGMCYGNNGEFMKKFHTRDGMGVNILLLNNLRTGIITKEKSKIVSKYFASHKVRINPVSPGNILFEGLVWDGKMEKTLHK